MPVLPAQGNRLTKWPDLEKTNRKKQGTSLEALDNKAVERMISKLSSDFPLSVLKGSLLSGSFYIKYSFLEPGIQ